MNTDIATFATRNEAQEIVESLDNQVYELAHGEYERPDYKVRKVRGEDAYYIHANYYFYAGTFYAKQDGGLSVNSNELYVTINELY